MASEIIMKTILQIIGFAVTGILGYLIAVFKGVKNQEKALKCILRSSITKIHYEYVPKGYIPQYERENVSYLYSQYKAMKGNSYVDIIMPEIMKLPIKIDEK